MRLMLLFMVVTVSSSYSVHHFLNVYLYFPFISSCSLFPVIFLPGMSERYYGWWIWWLLWYDKTASYSRPLWQWNVTSWPQWYDSRSTTNIVAIWVRCEAHTSSLEIEKRSRRKKKINLQDIYINGAKFEFNPNIEKNGSFCYP